MRRIGNDSLEFLSRVFNSEKVNSGTKNILLDDVLRETQKFFEAHDMPMPGQDYKETRLDFAMESLKSAFNSKKIPDLARYQLDRSILNSTKGFLDFCNFYDAANYRYNI